MSLYSNPPQFTTTTTTTTMDVPGRYSGLDVTSLNDVWPYDIEDAIKSINLKRTNKKKKEKKKYKFVIKILDIFLVKGAFLCCKEVPEDTLSEMMKAKDKKYDWIKKATDPVFYQRVPESSPDTYWWILSPLFHASDLINYGKEGKDKYVVRRESSKSLINRTALESLL